MDTDSGASTPCSNCRLPMERREFARRMGEPESVDFCRPCRLIWFDGNESVQLAPQGVIEIFKTIYASQGEWRNPAASQLPCPRCHLPLVYSHDIGKGGRFTYFRCDEGHGRLTPFTEFLREKQFVRVLAPAEVVKVRAEVRQVRCSGCGAMVDLSQGSACAHCGAPIAILDANAVERALRQWTAEAEQHDQQRARAAAMLAEQFPALAGHCLPIGRGTGIKSGTTGQPGGQSGVADLTAAAGQHDAIDLIEGGIASIGAMLQGLGYRF